MEKKMTPCEKLGYKVGDRFVAINDNKMVGRSKGDILELVRDDGSDCPFFKNVTTGEGLTACQLHNAALIRSSDATLKTDDTIGHDGKKYRVTLEEIPKYEFRLGMLCRVIWDGSEFCSNHSTSKTVIYLCAAKNDRALVAYATAHGRLAQGYVETSNLRPE